MNPFELVKRRRRTALQYAEIFASRDGVFHQCKRKLGQADKWELDHIVALALGGTDDDANLAPQSVRKSASSTVRRFRWQSATHSSAQPIRRSSPHTLCA